MRLFRPRTIRGQLIAGLVLFEALLIALFTAFLAKEQNSEIQTRMHRRLEYQVMLLAVQAEDELPESDVIGLRRVVTTMMRASSIHRVLVTDLTGRVMVASDPTLEGTNPLTETERRFLNIERGPVIFDAVHESSEAVSPVMVHGERSALVWVYGDQEIDRQQLRALLRITLFSAIVGAFGCTILADLLAHSITRPLVALIGATRQLIRDPEDTSSFPLKVTASNESADLAMAFNLMVTSLQEQRSGLHDTLALLDSMLANAPIGFAFFDRKMRFVRINQFLADMNEISIGQHLGRTVGEVLPESASLPVQKRIQEVFDTQQPVRDLEVTRELGGEPRFWLVNLYPVKTMAETVRWVGAIIVDISERRQSEETLRRTEKLVATARLAASIAHEINNPLEAVTNLLYLLRMEPLGEQATSYTEMAQYEVARVTEIAQQALRFYRQSTSAGQADVGELMNSVLAVYQGKIHALTIEVERRFEEGAAMFGYAGELRQLFANLVGNAIDAMTPSGGRLLIRVCKSRSWRHPETPGVRVTVADTGSGMTPEVQQRIFEPFYTTKEETGTGLGLWVSAGFIQKHGGTVRLRSRVAQRNKPGPSGTVFMLFFPVGGVQIAEAGALEQSFEAGPSPS